MSAIPGYSNAAIDETFGNWILNTMFAKVATGYDNAGGCARRHREGDEGDLGQVEGKGHDLIMPLA